MSATFHPPAEMLLDYASGALRPGPSLIVATHLALCPVCRKELHECEAIGGGLLEQSEEIAVSHTCRDKVMAALDAQEKRPDMPTYNPFLCHVLPTPLQGYVGCGITDVKWQHLSDEVDALGVKDCKCCSSQARLMRIKAGAAVPQHTHRGNEYTLVLAGSYHDGDMLYQRGDFIYSEAGTRHAPRADGHEDCICLVVAESSLPLGGLLSRLISPFTRARNA